MKSYILIIYLMSLSGFCQDYEYLENIKSGQVVTWLEKQNELTLKTLSTIPSRDTLLELQREFANSSKIEYSYVNPNNLGTDIFYLNKNDNRKTAALFHIDENNNQKLLFDPMQYEKGSNRTYQINYYQPSWNRKKVAISIRYDGRETSEILVYDLTTNELLNEVITNAKPAIGGISWLPNNSGFTYIKVNPTRLGTKTANFNTITYVHKLHTKQIRDVPIFSKKHSPEALIQDESFPIVYIDDANDKYVTAIVTNSSTHFDGYYKPIDKILEASYPWKKMFSKKEKIKKYLLEQDSIVYLTSYEASNFTIRKTSLMDLNFRNSKTVVPEDSSYVISDFILTSQGVAYTKLKNGIEAQLYHKSDSEHQHFEFPNHIGRIRLKSQNASSHRFTVEVQGWLTPQKWYTIDVIDRNIDEIVQVSKSTDLPIDKYKIEEIEVEGHDGAMIPLSLIYQNGLKKNNKTCVIIRGYGAYGLSMSPVFSETLLLPVRENCIYAVAHVRGGGEKGSHWRQQGYKQTKPNTWKDMISCVEYLIENDYTSKGKVGLWGGSAGGVLIGRAITERPDLFGACVIKNGILNTSRMEHGVNGADLATELGSMTITDERDAVLEMDAFENVQSNTEYPATLLSIGINDTRVAPWQSIKFHAKLKNLTTSENPVLLKTNFKTGHGLGEVQETRIQEFADAISFLLWQTGHPDYQPKEETLEQSKHQ